MNPIIKSLMLYVFMGIIIFNTNSVHGQNKQLDSLNKLQQVLQSNPSYQSDSAYLKSTNEIIAILLNSYSDSAFKMAEKNAKLAEIAGFKNIQAEAIRHQGFSLVSLGKYSDAKTYYQKSFELYQSTKNEKGQAKVYNNLAVLYKNIGDFPKSLEFHFKSLKIKQKINDQRGIAVSLGNIAILYKNQKRYKESLVEQLKAYRIFKQINDQNGISTASGNLASLYIIFKNYNKAQKYQDEALAISRNIEDLNGIAYHLDNVSRIKFYQKNINEAVELQLQALSIREKKNDLYGISSSCLSLGEYYQALNNPNKCFEFLGKGMKIAIQLGRKELTSSLHHHFYLANKQFGNLSAAIYHLEQHHLFEDTLYNVDVESKTIELKTKHEFEQKEIQLKEEKEKERLNFITKSENQRYIIIIISLFIAFLLAFSLSLQMSKVKVQISYQKLESANQEISMKTEALRQSLEELSEQKNEINELNFSLQEKVKERTKNLEEAYQQLRDFSFANSHHLRKPVANLLGLCEAISKNDLADPENLVIIQMMKESALELDTIIHELNKLDIHKNQL